jgi:hypothetical protein
MKKSKLNKLRLNKKSISMLHTSNIKGGITGLLCLGGITNDLIGDICYTEDCYDD